MVKSHQGAWSALAGIYDDRLPARLCTTRRKRGNSKFLSRFFFHLGRGRFYANSSYIWNENCKIHHPEQFITSLAHLGIKTTLVVS